MNQGDKWALWLCLGGLVLWFLTWGLIWQGRVNSGWADNIFEPALVAIQLGGIAIVTFLALYLRETTNGIRGAIAGAVVLPFLLLVVDLVTLPDFRASLAGGSGGGGTVNPAARLDFVQSMFDTFKWVVVTVVAFYFTAEATERVTENVQTAKTNRVENEVRVAQAQAIAAGRSIPDDVLLKRPG